MSAAPASPPGAAGSATERPPQTAPGAVEACPLCRAPLHPEQEWCLNCGAAARTRLAASPAWKAPIVTVAVVLVLSLGVLAGSLVKLAGGSEPAATQTTTVTTQAAAALTQAPPTATTPNTATATATTPTTATTTTTTTRTTRPRASAPGSDTATGLGGLQSRKSLEAAAKKLKIPGLKRAVEERLHKLGLQPHTKK